MTDNSTNIDSALFEEKTQQDLNNISQLQQQEKELYAQLDDVNLTSEQRDQIIAKINEISQIRMNLYVGLKDTYAYYKDNITASTDTLRQSILATDVLENELNRTKKRMNAIEDKTYNNLRLVEINTYFGKRYNAHAQLMKTIVYTCIPVIILALLYNNEVLPAVIYSPLVVMVIVVGMFLVGSQIMDMSNRDDMNWDEYNWNFNKQMAPSGKTVITDPTKQQDPWDTVQKNVNINGDGSVVCVGSACCYEGSTYDTEKNVCVPNALMYTTNTTTNNNGNSNGNEGFRGLVKYAHAEIKPSPVDSKVSPTFAKIPRF
jgi:hypothetical protein